MSGTSEGTRRVATRVVGVDGTRITLDGKPFPLTGVSFFNALYNPRFNASPEERRRWLETFLAYGVNTLRVWCQWDLEAPWNLIDTGPEQSMFDLSGEVRARHVETLAALLRETEALGMVVEVTLFTHQKQPNLPAEALERGARGVAERLKPYRSALVQLWNEDSTEWRRLFDAVKAVDPERLVTSSPGIANVMGDDDHNQAMDLLTPHTARRSAEVPFYEKAPEQVRLLLEKFGKPVLDDEPARSGPTQFGGIAGGTQPEWHIESIKRVREIGGYPIYHHDMFQYGYASPLTPPSGIPEPEWSPFHRVVFEYLRETKG